MNTSIFQHILCFLAILLRASSYAAQDVAQHEGKNDEQETVPQQKSAPKYYNYTLQESKRQVDGSVKAEELEEEKEDLADNRLTEKIKNKEAAVFFMLIISDNKTKALRKLFYQPKP